MTQSYFLEIDETYPFGQAHSSPSLWLARKYYPNDFRSTAIQITHFFSSFNQECLINVHHTLQAEEGIYLFYQYVPFKLEKWIGEINQQISTRLETQMLSLVDNLINIGVVFEFKPKCVGVSTGLHIKYYLDHFATNCALQTQQMGSILKQQVRIYFKQVFREKQTTDKRIWSISTVQSEQKMRRSPERMNGLQLKLSTKFENSKKRSQEVLQRFKKMKGNKGT